MVIAVLLATTWVISFNWFRTYTGIGILALRGADVWVAEAATATSDERSWIYLREVIESSNYGVNAAENAILRKSPEDQERLFRILANRIELVNWQRTYRARAEEARQHLLSGGT